MKILIIAKWFVPMNVIGAVRPYNFAKELSKQGVQVTCIAAQTDQNKSEPEFNFNVCRVPYGKLERWNKNRINQNKPSSRKIYKLVKCCFGC